MRRLATLAVTLVALGGTFVGTRSPADETTTDRCLRDQGTPDQVIESCTSIIRSGALDKSDSRTLETAYFRRANAWRAKGDHERAIGDYDEAIRLNPGNVSAHYNRGNAFLALGELDRAIESYDRAIELNPTVAQAFSNRASVWFRKGDYGRAAADYSAAIDLAPGDNRIYGNRGHAYFALGLFQAAARDFARRHSMDPKNGYWLLWQFASEGRAGHIDMEKWQREASLVDGRMWPRPLIDLYLGKETLDHLLEILKTLQGSRLDVICEVVFYVGEWAVFQGALAEARTLLGQADEVCGPTSVEHVSAAAELGRL